MRSIITAAATALAVTTAASAAPLGTAYVATSWAGDSVHFLDAGFNSIGSFADGVNPNALATMGDTIWAGDFTNSTVNAYDGNGAFQFGFTRADLSNTTGMEIVLTPERALELAVHNQAAEEVQFHDPITGSLLRTIPSVSRLVEGLAYDASTARLFQMAPSGISATDPSDGSVLYTIPNPASGVQGVAGTGITYIGNDQLAVASNVGGWWVIDATTGAVGSSGNNGLDMFGLKTFVPTPGAAGMLGLAGLAAARRRRG